ncbi:unnamed protein product [Protopolystoma xenopodis]|uniref:Protein quiver n=1 Tax=Protopolystoma xenopodis TaxID=117903 RepID=A0A448X191_9PLAT|nr:unnamed protein product [Protopolystoma xenopodis]
MASAVFSIIFALLLWPPRLVRGYAYGNLSCYECEMANREIRMALIPCSQPEKWAIVHNCVACLKFTQDETIDYRKPRWDMEGESAVGMARFCLRKFEPRFSDGCFNTYGSSSDQSRCYCSSNLCNRAKHPVFVPASGLLLGSVTLFVSRLCGHHF